MSIMCAYVHHDGVFFGGGGGERLQIDRVLHFHKLERHKHNVSEADKKEK